MNKPFVTFRTLASDNTVVALCSNHDAIAVNASAVMNYIEQMRNLTGGTNVEFNDTFRQICKDRVFYTYEPIENTGVDVFNEKAYVPAVVECVLLSDDRIALNINNTIMVCYAEEGNTMWNTKDEAIAAAHEDARMHNSELLDYLTAERRKLKEQIKELSEHISTRVKFRNDLINYDVNNNCY